MKNILYLSCHSILEHDETKLLTELGYNVFSLGSYINPQSPHDNKRPAYPGFYDDHLQSVAIQCSKENLHRELIDWADIILVMHRVDWIQSNWENIKDKRVILRTIGQNTPDIEASIPDGVEIIRYSPKEANIRNYKGGEVIRFYKDSSEFIGWNGAIRAVATVAQSMKKRGSFCGFDIFNQATAEFPRVIFGPDNDDSGLSGGLLSYEELKEAYKNHRVYFYTGTYPASYTLNFMEAFMTGMPIVAIGPALANLNIWDVNAYEIPDFIENGVNGFISDDISQLTEHCRFLLENPDEAMRIGKKARETAFELFDKKKISLQWRDFLR